MAMLVLMLGVHAATVAAGVGYSVPITPIIGGGVGLLFVILALLPWRKEGTGGLLLIVAGLLIGVAYVIWTPPGLPLASRVITTVVFSAPPLLAGILFMRHHRV